MKYQKLFCPKLKVLLDFKCNPNSKTLYVRIKEKLKTKEVAFYINEIELKDSFITEKELIEDEGDK